MLRSVSATTSRPAAAAAVARSNGSARRSSVAVAAKQGWSDADADEAPITKRELVLNSVNVAVLASLFSVGASPRPSGLGPRDFNGTKSLALCPATPNCISTAEEANDPKHYVPQWSYNPPGSGSSKPKKTKKEAMQDLEDAVTSLTPDKFTSQIIEKTDDYLYAEYTSPTFGFIDDVEFLLRDEASSEVEYRSASRIGESDGDANRKRIKALRKFLEPRGWKSIAAFE